MNRPELQQLAEERLLDAQALLAAQRWSAAYYLAGYAVECALKACVLACVERTGAIFEDKKFSEKCWTHDFTALVKLAGVNAAYDVDSAANLALKRNWDIVLDWNEKARYQKWAEVQAKDLYAAIINDPNGVMPWIRLRW